MGHQGTTKAVCDQNATGVRFDVSDKARDPSGPIWIFPIGLLNAPRAGKRLLKAGLPVTWSGAVESRDDEDRRHHSLSGKARRPLTRLPALKTDSRCSLLRRPRTKSTCRAPSLEPPSAAARREDRTVWSAQDSRRNVWPFLLLRSHCDASTELPTSHVS